MLFWLCRNASQALGYIVLLSILATVKDMNIFFEEKLCGWDIFEQFDKLSYNDIRDLVTNNLNKMEETIQHD
jgi:hypothetical protein